jgi:hypothetical protein
MDHPPRRRDLRPMETRRDVLVHAAVQVEQLGSDAPDN